MKVPGGADTPPTGSRIPLASPKRIPMKAHLVSYEMPSGSFPQKRFFLLGLQLLEECPPDVCNAIVNRRKLLITTPKGATLECYANSFDICDQDVETGSVAEEWSEKEPAMVSNRIIVRSFGKPKGVLLDELELIEVQLTVCPR